MRFQNKMIRWYPVVYILFSLNHFAFLCTTILSYQLRIRAVGVI